MIIYNVTIKIQPAIETQWLKWLQEIHIPEVIGTGCFTKATVARLLEVDDSDGPTFTVQYFASGKKDYDHYIDTFAPGLREKSFREWGDQFIAFRSVMEVVH